MGISEFKSGDVVVITLGNGYIDLTGIDQNQFVGIVVRRCSNDIEPYKSIGPGINNCYDVFCADMQSGDYMTVFTRSNDGRCHLIHKDYLTHVSDFVIKKRKLI